MVNLQRSQGKHGTPILGNESLNMIVINGIDLEQVKATSNITFVCTFNTRDSSGPYAFHRIKNSTGSDINCRFDRTCCDSQRFDTYRSAAEKVLLICKCISDTFIGTNILGAYQNVGTRFNKAKPANVLKCIKMTRITSASCKLHVIWELDRSSELFLRQ